MIPLLLKLRALPWRWIGVAAVVALAWWQVAAWGGRREAEGVASERARWEEAQRIATAEHDARIEKLNEDYHAKHTDLETRLAAAVSKPPAVRVVRVQSSTSCPAAVTVDAGQPEAAAPPTGPAGEGEADYRLFRDEVLRLGADAERFRQMALDAQKGWPK
jgi:hypothetical protein